MIRNTFIVVIILLFLLSLLFFNNFTGNVVLQENQETIIIPIKAHIVVDSSGRYTSNRDEENILITFDEVNRIWKKGNIHFQVEEIVETHVNYKAIPQAINGNIYFIKNNENFDENKINAFFTQSLDNINGLALVNDNSFLVADFTTVNDYRTTAHELGHLLGLRHVLQDNNLMARGKNGEFISNEEIEGVRKNLIQQQL